MEGKCREKKDLFAYNYSQDTNLLNLRFCIYLLAEELETIINNLDESHGNNYINSIDAKLEKRNEIINYLLKEKAVTQKLFTRVLSVFTNCYAECGDLLALSEVLSDSKEKGRFVAKVKAMQADLQIVEEFKSYAKTYFTEKDLQNLVSLQRDVPNPLTRDQYLKIADFVPVFDKVDRYQQLLEEYRTLSADMTLKEENYSRLLKKYDQLIKDFTELTVQGTRQIVNPLGPDDYNTIFSKYKEVKEQDRLEKEQADKERVSSGTKKPSTTKKSPKITKRSDNRDTTPQKTPTKASKSKSTTKKKKSIYEEETDAMSFHEPSKPSKPKNKAAIESPERYTGYHPSSNPFQGPGDANLSMDSLQPTLNNSFKQHHNQDIDLSKISKHDDSPTGIQSSKQGQKSQPKVTFENDKQTASISQKPKEEPRQINRGSPISTDAKKDSSSVSTTPGTNTNSNLQTAPAVQTPKNSSATNGETAKVEPPKPAETSKQQTPSQTLIVTVTPPPQTDSKPPAQSPSPKGVPPPPPPPMTNSSPPPPPPPSFVSSQPGSSQEASGGNIPPPPDLLTLLNQR